MARNSGNSKGRDPRRLHTALPDAEADGWPCGTDSKSIRAKHDHSGQINTRRRVKRVQRGQCGRLIPMVLLGALGDFVLRIQRPDRFRCRGDSVLERDELICGVRRKRYGEKTRDTVRQTHYPRATAGISRTPPVATSNHEVFRHRSRPLPIVKAFVCRRPEGFV
jgi:hypothetical protein